MTDAAQGPLEGPEEIMARLLARIDASGAATDPRKLDMDLVDAVTALKEQTDEIERLRRAGDELYVTCIPVHEMLLDIGASTKVPVVAEQAGPLRQKLDDAMQPWREEAMRG